MIEERLLKESDSNKNDVLIQYPCSNEINQNGIIFIDNQVANPEKNGQDLTSLEKEEDIKIQDIEIIDTPDKFDDDPYKDVSTFKLMIDVAKGCGRYSLYWISLYIGKPITKIFQKANTKCVQWFNL